MRYGLGELRSGHHSTLREHVSRRMVDLELTTGELARKAGVSPNTLKRLGAEDQKPSPRTLRKLTKPLGFDLGQLERWRAADEAQQHGVASDQWPPEIYRIATAVMELDNPADRRTILAMVRAFVDERTGA